MALVDKNNPVVLKVPHEPGETISVRYLSGSECEELGARASSIAMHVLDGMSAEVLAAAPGFSNNIDDDEPADPKDNFPRTETLRLAVVDWSYPTPCSQITVDDLDNPTATWLHEEVVKMNSRSVHEGEALSGEPENIILETDGSPQS